MPLPTVTLNYMIHYYRYCPANHKVVRITMGSVSKTPSTPMARVLSYMARFLLRIVLLGVGYYFLPQLVYGLQLGSYQTLLIVALSVGVFDALVRPLVKLVAFPADLLTLGMLSRLLYPLLVLAFLVSLPFWLPGVGAMGTTLPQHLQAALAYGVFTLTVLAVTR
jgi:putative membrane protein